MKRSLVFLLAIFAVSVFLIGCAPEEPFVPDDMPQQEGDPFEDMDNNQVPSDDQPFDDFPDDGMGEPFPWII